MKRTKCKLMLLAAFTLGVTSLYAQNASWMEMATVNAGLDTSGAFNIFVSDINNDKYPDMVTIRRGWGVGVQDALCAYINVQDPGSTDPADRMFVDVTGTSGVNAMPGAGEVSKGVLVAGLADVNNDGFVDIVRANYYHSTPSTAPDDRCEILLGDGKGKFTIVKNSGLHELGVINVTAMSFLDYDKDGNLDVFLARWFDNYSQNDLLWSPGILMKGNGDGTFTNVSAQAGITEAEPMYGCSVVDWNNDGWPDIATAPYCRTRGQLWKNNGNGTFTNVAVAANYNARYLAGDNGQGMCMWSPVPEDYDNDGDMDFFFSLVHGGNDANEGRSTIVRNGGSANKYALTPDRSLITKRTPYSSHNGDYDASWLDIDNDGLIDLSLVQGHYMPATDRLFIFKQDQSNKFTDITGSLGLIKTETSDLHMLEAMDYDLDGDDDIILCRNAQPRELHLIKNLIGQDNNWSGVTLLAPQGVNKSAIGARIYVWAGGIQHMREVYAARGNNGGQQPFAMLFGLGNNSKIDSVKVQWPDAANSTTLVRNPPVNKYITITKSGLDVPMVIAGGTSNTLKVYPNPAKDFILLQLSNNEVLTSIEIYNLLGQKLQTLQNDANATTYCSISHLAPGSYIIKATTRQGEVYTQTLVKSN